MAAPASVTDDASARRQGLLALVNAGWTTQAVYAACRLDLPDHMAASGEVGALADACQAHAPALHRLLRALASIGVCDEIGDACYALTPLGEMLRRDHPQSLREWALQVGGPQWLRWGELTESVQTGHSWRLRHEGEDSFSSLADEAPDAQAFHRAMGELTRPVAAALLDAVDWQGVRHIVDVGGGSGVMLAVLLAGLPQVRATLFDQPHALRWAPALLEHEAVAARCMCVPGSFFEQVPTGGDVYLMKSVLHNWDEPRSLDILQRCHAAMGPAARLLVIERVMPERMQACAPHQALARSDLNMLVALSGCERRMVEYDALFGRAGLERVEVTALPGGWSVIEARSGLHET